MAGAVSLVMVWCVDVYFFMKMFLLGNVVGVIVAVLGFGGFYSFLA